MVCKKLIKWSLISTVGAVGVGYLLFGKNLKSYVTTAYGDVRQAVVGSVPIDFELRRARTLIEKIDPEIRDARRDVARAEVELDALRGQIRNLKNAIAKAERKMGRHRKYIRGEGTAVPVFNGHRDYGVAAVKAELIRTFDMYRNQVDLLESKEATAKRQKHILESARKKLLAVRAERNKLVDTVEMLEARKRELDAMAATTKRAGELDTSNLREAKRLIADIKKRLDVSTKIIQEELFLSNGEVAVADENRDILKEMEEYFGRQNDDMPRAETLERVK